MKNTPGEWVATLGVADMNKESNRYFKSVRAYVNKPLSKIVSTAWGDTQYEAEANAALIASAPTLKAENEKMRNDVRALLDALKEAKKELEACYKRIGYGVENETSVMKKIKSVLQ